MNTLVLPTGSVNASYIGVIHEYISYCLPVV